MNSRKRIGTKGSILILVLPIIFLMVSGALLFARWARACAAAERATSIAEVTLLSALRLRVEALESLAERGSELQRFVSTADDHGLVIHTSDWVELSSLAASLKKSIPGYKGRIQAVLKVVMNAHRLAREDLVLMNSAASDLGIEARGEWVRRPDGQRKWIDGIWLKRNWSLSPRTSHPAGVSIHAATLLDLEFGEIVRTRAARLCWDVDPKLSQVQTHGNGGFPFSWEMAHEGGQFDPYRWPLFTTQVISEQGGSCLE